MLLNTSGASNGVEELWIDGVLDAQATGLNFVGTYTTYGINIFRLENYMNAGTGQSQYRDWDNFVVLDATSGVQLTWLLREYRARQTKIGRAPTP